MKITPKKADIDLYKEGFKENDILNRAGIGQKLSTLVEKVDDPLVIALEGELLRYLLDELVKADDLTHWGN